ncbi:MAG: isocitrate lyase/phosphoenolpyruvate mutase family protein [Alphaproteobacteria bacterium]|nr:isocitrate lyase/phosphoenolpyruvate mutase family protein [Alphaproteobacteria bacterium]
MSADARAQEFDALHKTKPGFIMPNAWDPGSAIMLASEGFSAIATTSAGVAFSLGKPDYQVADARFAVSREEMFDAMRAIVVAVRVPVNGDLEAGYGDTPEAVAETIRMAIDIGLAGGNIEDVDPRRQKLYDETLAAERIAAARQAIDAAKSAFVLTARTDALVLSGPAGFKEMVGRANRYREAGADCLFPVGVANVDLVKRAAPEIDGPINCVMGLGQAAGNAKEMIAAGAQRISVGGSIARSVYGFIRSAARELRDEGTLTYAANQVPQGELNGLFAGART